MSRPTNPPWLHRFAVLTAVATLALIGIGGLVTSHEAGLAVPDWPTSAGYNMFALPVKFWTGGIFYEHTHRLWATVVGTLVVALTRWLGGAPSRRWLALIGGAEMLAGFGIIFLAPNLKGTGHFLTGIGGVVLLAGIVWTRNAPADRPLVKLGWLVFGLVQFQGLLGGLRVVLLKDEIGIFHAALAQIFFVLLCAIALLTSRWWMELNVGQASRLSAPAARRDRQEEPIEKAQRAGGTPALLSLRRFLVLTTALILFQLILGATMRHQHAGLAIPDFPLAYGKLWPATDAAAVAHYNAHRMEATAVNPITAFQIILQMAHRIAAILILAVAAAGARSAWRTLGGRNPLTKLSFVWLGLILIQAGLGAATVLTNKAADIATAHVLAGALSLAIGVLLCILCARSLEFARTALPYSTAPASAAETAAGSDPWRAKATVAR